MQVVLAPVAGGTVGGTDSSGLIDATAAAAGRNQSLKPGPELPETPKRKLARRIADACEDTPDSKHATKRRRIRPARGGGGVDAIGCMERMHDGGGITGAKEAPHSGKHSDACTHDIHDMHDVQDEGGNSLTEEAVKGMKV